MSSDASRRRLYATERKFGYANLLDEMGVSQFPDEGEGDTGTDMSTVLVHCAMLPLLVASLPCTSCQRRTLSIRAVDRTLGMVCGLETFCTSCDKVVNSTLSSDRIGGAQVMPLL